MSSTTFSLPEKEALLRAAIEASKKSYSPYSNYAVGAALLSATGKLYKGCNVENASYGATICAERTAVVKAVSEGERDFVAVAVVTRNGGSPCGVCRQVLYEFNPDMMVFLGSTEGKLLNEYPLHVLLPNGFGPKQLT
jgi:cytidine deaminase